MSYITKQELEKRKELLQKRLEDKSKDNDESNKAVVTALDWSINEINYWLDYLAIKETNNTFKPTNCFKCKKYGVCGVKRNVTSIDILEHCALFEEAEKC